MDIQAIKQLIKIVEKSDIGEIELIEEGRKIRISKSSKLVPSPIGANGVSNYVSPQVMPATPVEQNRSGMTSSDSAAESKAKESIDSDKYYEVLSPMVGTFYRAPSPEAEPYVKVGDKVTSETTLCIIEAMKLMNEIQSDFNGRLAEILIENGQPVQYNQPLFLIEKGS